MEMSIHSLFYVQHDGKPDQVHGAAQSFSAKLGQLEEGNCEVPLKTGSQRNLKILETSRLSINDFEAHSKLGL